MLRNGKDDHLLWDVPDGGPPTSTYHWGCHAAGFMRSGSALLERAQEMHAAPLSFQAIGRDDLSVRFAEEVVVSGLYLIRHGVELLLKMLALCKAEDEGTRTEIHKTHNLKSLLPPARAIIEKKDGEDYLDALDAVVAFFHEIDPDGTRLRYPVASTVGDTSYDLTVLSKAATKIAVLIHTADIIDHEKEIEAEMMAYYL